MEMLSTKDAQQWLCCSNIISGKEGTIVKKKKEDNGHVLFFIAREKKYIGKQKEHSNNKLKKTWTMKYQYLH